MASMGTRHYRVYIPQVYNADVNIGRPDSYYC